MIQKVIFSKPFMFLIGVMSLLVASWNFKMAWVWFADSPMLAVFCIAVGLFNLCNADTSFRIFMAKPVVPPTP